MSQLPAHLLSMLLGGSWPYLRGGSWLYDVRFAYASDRDFHLGLRLLRRVS